MAAHEVKPSEVLPGDVLHVGHGERITVADVSGTFGDGNVTVLPRGWYVRLILQGGSIYTVERPA